MSWDPDLCEECGGYAPKGDCPRCNTVPREMLNLFEKHFDSVTCEHDWQLLPGDARQCKRCGTSEPAPDLRRFVYRAVEVLAEAAGMDGREFVSHIRDEVHAQEDLEKDK